MSGEWQIVLEKTTQKSYAMHDQVQNEQQQNMSLSFEPSTINPGETMYHLMNQFI